MQMQIILSYVDTQYNHNLHNKESIGYITSLWSLMLAISAKFFEHILTFNNNPSTVEIIQDEKCSTARELDEIFWKINQIQNILYYI